METEKKRIPSAYVIFAKTQERKIKLENPTLSFLDRYRIIYRLWETLSEGEKSVFYKLSNNLKHN